MHHLHFKVGARVSKGAVVPLCFLGSKVLPRGSSAPEEQ
jgi:hypothetical protein